MILDLPGLFRMLVPRNRMKKVAKIIRKRKKKRPVSSNLSRLSRISKKHSRKILAKKSTIILPNVEKRD